MALIFYPIAHPQPGMHPRVSDDTAYDHAVVATGELRPPRRGEWYISGAIPEGYMAPNDLSTPHRIARLVKRPGDKQVQNLVTVATYAVADFRALALEVGESNPVTSPALRAAQRLADALKPFTEGIS